MSRSWGWGPILAVLACAVACAGIWGFTIDDAFISIRYAHNVLAGHGWRFVPSGPPTDGVTPLPWPIVILPFVSGDPLAALVRVRVFGVIVHLVSIGILGARIQRIEAPRVWKIAAIGCVALCLPVAAHASSGMETAFVMALATCAVSFEQPICAGLAASLRPEMIPWAIALSSGLAIADRKSKRAIAMAGLVAFAPALVVIAIRLAVFGRAAPLAVLAKPSDLGQGFVYAIAALVASAVPALVIAPFAFRKEKGAGLAIAMAALVHVFAVIAAGGDWMPYARLIAPIAPGLAIAFVLGCTHSSTWSLAVRSGIAAIASIWMWIVAAPAGRHIDRDRTALVLHARTELASARRVATVDIGWVSAATDAPILDLAGLTDPSIAILPGSHTSKRVDPAMLLDRDPDVLLLYVDHVPNADRWQTETYTRVVEARLAYAPSIAEHFGRPVFLPLGSSKGYILVRKN